MHRAITPSHNVMSNGSRYVNWGSFVSMNYFRTLVWGIIPQNLPTKSIDAEIHAQIPATKSKVE